MTYYIYGKEDLHNLLRAIVLVFFIIHAKSALLLSL